MSAYLWLALVALVAWSVTFALVAVALRIGELLGIIDRPRPGEVQERPVPRTGGYALLVGLWAAALVAALTRPADLPVNAADDWRGLGVLLGSALIVPLAWLDDRKRLGPLPQLVGQFAVAAVPVLFGLRLGSVASPLGVAVELPEWLDVPLTLLWIVGMINALNWVDVMDGLAGGLATLAALVLFARSLWFGQLSIAVLPLAVAAAALGFLPRNVHPARVFMGTSGSTLLGYALATAAIFGGAKLGTAFLVLGVPILDTAWVIWRRLAAGRSPFHGGDAEHLPQKLHRLGLGQRQTVALLWGLSAAFGLLALSLHSPAEGPPVEKAFLLLGMAAVVGAVLVGVTALSGRKRG